METSVITEPGTYDIRIGKVSPPVNGYRAVIGNSAAGDERQYLLVAAEGVANAIRRFEGTGTVLRFQVGSQRRIGGQDISVCEKDPLDVTEEYSAPVRDASADARSKLEEVRRKSDPVRVLDECPLVRRVPSPGPGYRR